MFQLDQTATINAVAIGKGKGDGTPVCVTLSLAFASVGLEAAAAALGCKEEDLAPWFGEEGDTIHGGITDISTNAKFEDQHKITVLNAQHTVAKVSKIKCNPINGKHFALKCAVQIQNPTENMVEELSEYINDSTQIKLETKGDLVDQSEAANDEGSREPVAAVG